MTRTSPPLLGVPAAGGTGGGRGLAVVVTAAVAAVEPLVAKFEDTLRSACPSDRFADVRRSGCAG